ncbi:ATP-binding cassette domain-containing protein [Nocardia sp. NBC_00508]|uniref:ABC transporter ATP-binding protein/permease n=1 Tax=Nocardia sp. NBC_00508 TaxID=2975992 RepID=UPI002E807FE7|nr:ATP-binding cassette domain-containing protein [Nocardia sp. NBC_00508]WUD63827.1 ATP-binding cassette domain-containing protein [Nocardia sp. NBC_00508]
MARPPIDPRLWRYARSARSYLALSVALSLLITGAIVLAAVLIGRVLAGVVTDPGQRTVGAWTTELTALALAIAVRVLATWVQSRLAHRAGASVVAELETAVLAAGARLSPRELDSRRTELAVVVGAGLSGLRGYLVGYVPALLLAALVPPIVLAVIAAHDLTSGVIVVITLPLIPIFMILIGLLTQGRAEATLAATTRLSDQLLDLFAGMPTLRALGRETGEAEIVPPPSAHARQVGADPGPLGSDAGRGHTMQHRVRDLGDALRLRTMRALRIAFLSSMVLELLATLSVALIAVSIGLRLVFGEMSLYAGLVALVLAPEVYLPLRMVGERFHAAQDGMAAADKAFAILESAPACGDTASIRQAAPDQPEQGRNALPDKGSRASSSAVVPAPGVASVSVPRSSISGAGLVEVTDLSMGARDGFAPAGLSATFSPGSMTVLAGPNGSGKSTAIQAILGLIAPDRGAVTVDGIDLREMDVQRWWARVAWLPQRPVLVPGTLRENLELLGAQTVDDAPRGPARVVDDLEAACVATGFDAVLDELPDRWNTVVGPGGVGLSLGQRQRLALTRVLAADRPILLLDEPTAHLDATAEATVLAALRVRARAGATVIVIGHRPTVLAAADRVVQVRAARVSRTETGAVGTERLS